MKNEITDLYAVRGAKLRQLATGDLGRAAALQEIIFQHLADPSWYVASTVEEMDEVIGRGETFGFFAGETLVGYAAYSPWHARGDEAYARKLGEPAENTFDVRDMLTHPRYRRRGIQSAFLRLFEEIARALGGRAMYATIDPKNAPSIAGFEKAGFVLFKTQPAYDGRLRGYFKKEL